MPKPICEFINSIGLFTTQPQGLPLELYNDLLGKIVETTDGSYTTVLEGGKIHDPLINYIENKEHWKVLAINCVLPTEYSTTITGRVIPETPNSVLMVSLANPNKFACTRPEFIRVV